MLTGSQPQIAELAKATGFVYRWVESAGQYAHPAVLMVCSPEGKLTRYLYGVSYDPNTVRLSLVEAADGKVGSTADRFVLTCFRYDGHQGKYAFFALNLMKAGGVAILVLVTSLLGYLFWREPRMGADGRITWKSEAPKAPEGTPAAGNAGDTK